MERQVENPKFILIETDFTANVHKFMEFGRKFQFEEAAFFLIYGRGP